MYYVNNLDELGSPFSYSDIYTTSTVPFDYTSKPPLYTSNMVVDNDNAYEWQKVPYEPVSSNSFTVNHDGPNPWDFSIKQGSK